MHHHWCACVKAVDEGKVRVRSSLAAKCIQGAHNVQTRWQLVLGSRVLLPACATGG